MEKYFNKLFVKLYDNFKKLLILESSWYSLHSKLDKKVLNEQIYLLDLEINNVLKEVFNKGYEEGLNDSEKAVIEIIRKHKGE